MHSPRVSIGIPVRNGQRFIRRALDSLLAQTYGNFEIVICDNCSSDDTESICRQFMSRDPRIRFIRNERNLGPAGNFNECVLQSRGEYFRWHAHDDMCAPEYLQRCVEALDADASIVLAYPRTMLVDDCGKPIEEYNFHPRTDSDSTVKRFAELVLVNHRKHRAVEIFGLMRASAMRKTPLQGAYARGDSVMLVRLALLGRFVELEPRLFLSRSHSSQSMQTLPASQKSGRSPMSRLLGSGPLPPPEWWDESRRGKINFPEWNLFGEYWRTIGAAPLSLRQRSGCYGVMLRWLLRNIPKLARDVIFAIETLVMRVMHSVSTTRPVTGDSSE